MSELELYGPKKLIGESEKKLLAKTATLASKALIKRLNDKKYVNKIPDHTLAKIAIESMKLSVLLDRMPSAQKPTQVTNVFALFEAIKGLPPDRRMDILADGMKRLQDDGLDFSQYEKTLAELVGEDEASKLLAIEGTTNDEQ